MTTAMTRMKAEMATMATLVARRAVRGAEAGVLSRGPRESRRTLGRRRTTREIRPTTLDEGAGHGHVLPHKTTTGHDRHHSLPHGHRRGAWSTTDLAWLGLIKLRERSLASQLLQQTHSQAKTDCTGGCVLVLSCASVW